MEAVTNFTLLMQAMEITELMVIRERKKRDISVSACSFSVMRCDVAG